MDMIDSSLFFPVCAFLAVILLVLPLKILAPRLGLVDRPGGRKKHDGDIPLIGGVVVIPVFIAVSVLIGDGFLTHWPLYSALILLLLTGIIDDRVHLPAFVKFGLQFVAAGLIVIPGGAQLYQLGNLFGLGDVGLALISLPFSVVAVVLLINAINLMDGLDGLAGGTVFVILGWMLFACLAFGEAVYAPSLMVLIGALAGFLFYNMRSPFRKHASIFMGDAGSMSLGLLIAWYAIQLSPENVRIIEPMSVAWVLAVPIWDECAQFYRRVKEGRHPFSADRGHFHHHFIRAGFTPGQATSIILAIVFVMGAIGVLGLKVGVPLPVLTIVWIAGLLAHIAFSRNTDNYLNLIQKIRG